MIVAGVDVGNATTEVVLMRDGAVLGADRVPTRGLKGSSASLRGAASLVVRLQRSLGVAADLAVLASLRPVDTTTVTVPATPVDTGRLRVVTAGVRTPGGTGQCIGRPYRLTAGGSAAPGSEPAVVLVPAGLGYAEVAARVAALGDRVGAVLLAGDEAVLVANRLPRSLPVVDQVDLDGLEKAARLGVEVRRPGEPLQLLGDPVALSAGLEVPAAQAAAVVSLLADCSNAVVALEDGPPPEPGEATDAWIELDGTVVEFYQGAKRLDRVGAAQRYRLPGADPMAVDDLYTVDLGQVADRAGTRRGSVASRSFLLAGLRRWQREEDHAAGMAEQLRAVGTPMEVSGGWSEPAAARTGALTTPGAEADCLVVDLGAGTVDAIGPATELVAAGAGELLTLAVAATLGLTRSAADWVKRGPAVRVDGDRRFEAEDGTRGFLDRPAPVTAAGMLAVPGPAGWLPFDRHLSPAEWRALRLRLKEAVLGVNLRRVLASLPDRPVQVLAVGGVAGDPELLGVLSRSLPSGLVAGRAAVTGGLGHRYAAALGLALKGREAA